MNYLQLLISGDEPDLIIIKEILPKVSTVVSDALLSLPGYAHYTLTLIVTVSKVLQIGNVVLVYMYLTHYMPVD